MLASLIFHLTNAKVLLTYITFKESVRTSLKTQHVFKATFNCLVLLKEIIAAFFENSRKCIKHSVGNMQIHRVLKKVVACSYHKVVESETYL